MPKKKGLRDSHWNNQSESARECYFGVPTDYLLQGFRAEAGLAAPGKPIGEWCEGDSGTVLIQCLSEMSRRSRAIEDSALRDKASYLGDLHVVLCS
jgi:hypothetical protein